MVTLALCLNLKAGEIPYSHPANIIVAFTNVTFSSNINGSVTWTNVQQSTYTTLHTFMIFSTAWTNTLAIGTNLVSVALDRTIDGQNWITCATTNLTGAVANAFEYDAYGKWYSYRWRITAGGTNLTVTADYMAEPE